MKNFFFPLALVFGLAGSATAQVTLEQCDSPQRGETQTAVKLLDEFPIVSAVGRDANLAALTQDARASLEQSETEPAMLASRRALSLRPDSEELQGNLSVARYHHAVALVRDHQSDAGLELAKELDAAGSAIPVPDREAVRGYASQAVARSSLEDPSSADPSRAVSVLEEAHGYASANGRSYPFIDCDLAGALEADAVLKLAREQPGPAVDALDRSDELVPRRQIVKVLRPQALLAHGTQLLGDRDFEPAITQLRRAHEETDGKDERIRQSLGLAWYSKGAAEHQQENLDQAITDFREATEVIPEDENVRFSLGEVLFARADKALEVGWTDGAAEDLEEAARVSSRHRTGARQRLQYIPGMNNRLAAIRSAPGWLRIPDVSGEVPRDLDGDGDFDRVAYYGPGSDTPVAVAEPVRGSRPPSQLVFTSQGAGSNALAIVRDLDGDGRFDERTEYEGQEISGFLTDVDGDAWPDVRGIDFQPHGFEFRQQALSGRLMMHVKGGVVGTNEDFFTDPDAYLILKKNSYQVGRTSADQDTHYPTWYQGIVLDYKHGDRVRLELWDEDFLFDDFIDHYETTELPTSGVYEFSRRKAAVEIDVSPSRLPEGHQIAYDPPAVHPNVFRDRPTAVPEVADIIANARSSEATTRAIQWVTKAAVTEVLLPRLVPNAARWQVFLLQLVVEHAVLDPAMGLVD